MEQQDAESSVEGPRYKLRLYITGTTPVSSRAVVNIRRFCEEHLPERCDLEIIDVFTAPNLAKEEQLIAVPTLVKLLPLPIRRLIGDMSGTDKLLKGLDISPVG